MTTRDEPRARPFLAGLALAGLLALIAGVSACSGDDEPSSASEPTTEPHAPNEPSGEPSGEPAAAPTAADVAGCPGSPECIHHCRTQCESEHGLMLDLEALRACTQRGGAPAECTREGSNEEARRCFLTCRGLDPADFPVGGSQ